MKIKKIMAVIAVAVVLNMASGCKKSCEICDEVASLRSDIKGCRDKLCSGELGDGTKAAFEVEKQLTSLLGQYATLSKHECGAEVENVKNKEYYWIESGMLGTYTGEWKVFGPCGTGTYKGTNPYFPKSLNLDHSGDIIEYSGEWEYGVPNGYGEYLCYHEKNGLPTNNGLVGYEGEFVGGKFEGQGTLTLPYDRERDENLDITKLMIITSTFSGGELTGNAEYVVYDDDGNLYDRGYVDKNRIIIQSERSEQQRKEAEQQTKDTLGDIGRGIWDALF